MLSSISPFGERSRNSRWWLTVTAYLVGSVLGGMTMGAAFGALGQALPGSIDGDTALVVLALAAAYGVAADLGIRGFVRPTLHRQVNEDWLTTYRGWVYGIGFGFQLGLGLATIVTTSTMWLTWLAAGLTGSWLRGLLIGAVFGAARGAFILVTRPIQDPAALRSLFRTIAAQAPAVHRVTMVAAGLAAATAVGGLIA